ncbi:MAG: glycosyl transferase [Candidatus Melainabacteria bacterium RIFOXYA12_FULL_32_12]|nr:MAG: glycosyl transferase [Candidatus Melainabacteria bacterium RIFOXYA2_FULL_32_9]OGI27558.1 MAG: glycosyl transferase [Candidatus Melainabacteria bacterium RIFOXYA12_FULL_32_12]
MSLAPIALFVYNRLEHLEKTINALQNNILALDSELYIFSDGAKDEKSSEQVNKIRKYIKTISEFKKIIVIEREKNLGLANSIISGVTEVINKYGKIIVLEDDMVTSRYFLKYMNEALEYYENEDRVISIHGYIYPVKKELPNTFFMKGADCWGWATWKRGWDLFEHDGKKLLQELENKKLTYEFDFNGSYIYIDILKAQVTGINSSWAIRWYASAFLKDRLTLYPGKSLVQNIGLDGIGTHCKITNVYDSNLADNRIKIDCISLKENKSARKQIEKYFRSISSNRKGFWHKIRNNIKRIIKNA